VSQIVGLEEHELAKLSINEPSSSEYLYQEGEGALFKNITRRHNKQLPVSLNISEDLGK
jgi:hypothetical protein